MYYTTFNIYRTCMCRAPARPVRACPVRTCCTAVQEHGLRATTLQCNAKPTLSSHFTVPSSHPALHKPHFISAQATLQQLLSHSKLFHTEAFYTQKLLHKEGFTLQPFNHSKLLHTANFDTEKFFHTEAFTQRTCRTQQLLHRKTFTHSTL